MGKKGGEGGMSQRGCRVREEGGEEGLAVEEGSGGEVGWEEDSEDWEVQEGAAEEMEREEEVDTISQYASRYRSGHKTPLRESKSLVEGWAEEEDWGEEAGSAKEGDLGQAVGWVGLVGGWVEVTKGGS